MKKTRQPREGATVEAFRRFTFCAGHRVHGHEGKCSNVHGHNYVARVWFAAPALDGLGRVIDFGVVKRVVGEWIEKHWDHGTILWVDDEEAVTALRMIHGQKLHTMQRNPTAENMASDLLVEANAILRDLGVRCTRVELEETENCGVVVGWE